jgi:hypothetical protein
MYILIISRWILLRIRNVSNVVQRIKKSFMFNFPFPRKLCCLWDNVEKCGTASVATDDKITRPMRFAFWITKATDTHSEYVILLASCTEKIVPRTRLNVTFIRTLTVLFFKIQIGLQSCADHPTMRHTSQNRVFYDFVFPDKIISISDAIRIAINTQCHLNNWSRIWFYNTANTLYTETIFPLYPLMLSALIDFLSRYFPTSLWTNMYCHST